MLVKNKVCSIPVMKKKILGRKHFSLSVHLCTLVPRGLIPLFGLHLALKYCLGRQNIFATAFVLDSFLFAIIFIPR